MDILGAVLVLLGNILTAFVSAKHDRLYTLVAKDTGFILSLVGCVLLGKVAMDAGITGLVILNVIWGIVAIVGILTTSALLVTLPFLKQRE